MHIHHDPDEFKVVVKHTPCTRCNGDMLKCDGGCNGSSSYSLVRRPQSELDKIKEDKRIKHENEILAEAAMIRAQRGHSQ